MKKNIFFSKLNKKFLFSLSTLLTIFLNRSTSISFAQINLKNGFEDPSNINLPSYKIQDISIFIMRSMEVILVITGLWMFICIIWSGIEWQLAKGNKSDIDKAKTRLTNCTLGLASTSLAYAVIIVIQFFFGINLFPTV